MTLDKIKAQAQRDADRTGKEMAVLNLNCFNPLYVVRSWDERFIGTPQLVCKVHPGKVEWPVE